MGVPSHTRSRPVALAGRTTVSNFAAVALAAAITSGGVLASGAAAAADISKAKEVVAQATARVTTATIPERAPAIAKDKLIVTIPCSYAAEGCKSVVDAVGEAAGVIGWRTKMIDPAGNPEKARQAVRQAILLHADGIVFGAPIATTLKADVAAARAAGIKVVETLEPPTPGFADASVANDRVQAGTWAAAFLATQTEGAGHVILVNDPEFRSIADEAKGFKQGLSELCPSCTIEQEVDFQIANLQIGLPAQYQGALRAHPATNATVAVYDPIYYAVAPMIRQSPAADTMTVVGFNGDKNAVEDIKKDSARLKATIAYPSAWIGYVAVDQLIRLFAGETLPKEIERYTIPNKLIVKDNVTTIPWDGDVDWKGAYLKIWKEAK